MTIKITEYLDNLKLFPASDEHTLVEALKQFYSEKKAMHYFNKWAIEMDNRGNPDYVPHNQDDIYTLMSEDYFESLVLSGCWNYNRYVFQGEWAEKNKDLFGNRIIDIGCMNGLFTCYLASILPDSEITGVDRNKTSLKVAKRLAKELNLTNVKFQYVSFERVEGNYDTVVSAYLLHEIFNPRITQEYRDLTEDQQISYWYRQMNPYTFKISSLLDKGCNAICFEKCFNNIALCGLLKTFKENDLKLNEKYFSLSKSDEGDFVASYVLSKDNCDDVDYKKQYEHILELQENHNGKR